MEEAMTKIKVPARLRKWGNSTGVVIPAILLKKKGLLAGDYVEITVEPYGK